MLNADENNAQHPTMIGLLIAIRSDVTEIKAHTTEIKACLTSINGTFDSVMQRFDVIESDVNNILKLTKNT